MYVHLFLFLDFLWRDLVSLVTSSSDPSSTEELFLVPCLDLTGELISPDEAGEAGSRILWRLDLLGDGGELGEAGAEGEGIGVNDLWGDAGPLGDNGETGPRGPGLIGERDLSRKSGGDGVSSPDEGGDGVPVISTLVCRSTGGVFLWIWGGDIDILRVRGCGVIDLGLTGWRGGDGDGEMDSKEPLLALRVLFRNIGGGDGVKDSILCRGLGGGDREPSKRRL